MKIRKKITLWISGASVLATIAFSSFVFFEMVKESFLLIDKELAHMVESLVTRMEAAGTDQYDLSQMPYNPDHYWIKVSRGSRVLYRSRIARFTDIPLSKNKTAYITEKIIPRSKIRLGQDSRDEVFFRVMEMKVTIGSLPAIVHIAKPIEKFEKELIELIGRFAIGLTLCSLVIIFLSYHLAGKILSPVSSITRLATEISDKSLDKRIPLSPTKDELYDLSVSLNRMFDRLQYSFQRQKEFIGNASHELKSPITLLLLAQEELVMNQTLPPSAGKSIIKQLDTTRRMSHLVKHLLDLSRLEQQETLGREPIDLTMLVKRTINDYSDLFSAKNIRLQIRIPDTLPLSGDPEKLYRLLINLIDNGIRYNLEKKGRLMITGCKTASEILLEISNTGPGIPDKDLERVFEQFYRVEKSRSTTHGGSGLGLAIAQKIVQLHDGTIKIANEPKGYVTVKIFFPLTA